MCGIAGFTAAADNRENREIIKDMCDIMAHRGPDGEGLYLDGTVALGHRRLSLIDLEGGAQPMIRENDAHDCAVTSPATRADGSLYMPEDDAARHGRFAIVFNGEIYNYRELRRELEDEGWRFRTDSDTEVLLVSYIAWGESCLERLRGMFAFAIWDAKAGKLFCARDFFGIKPFYYAVVDHAFVFASEAKCILEYPGYERKLNERALEDYMCFQFNPGDETFFEGIWKLPAAHCMTIYLDESGKVVLGSAGVQPKCYWSAMWENGRGDDSLTHDEAVQSIREAFSESVRYHNVADVEVGSFLSSGIDSSYMAACLAKENPDIKTFTVGFGEYGHERGERDEISWAEELAGKMGVSNTSHHIGEDEYWEAVPKVQWHMDEPLADPSAIALWFVDELASRDVKAVLSGEGADEFFGGYKIYEAPLESAKLRFAPKFALRGASRVAGKLGIRGANYLWRAGAGVSGWYYTNANGAAFSESERDEMMYRESESRIAPTEVLSDTYAWCRACRCDDVTSMQVADINCWLVGDILLKTDKMSMAHSLESRVPFLDRGVFDVASRLPVSERVTLGETKVALREAALDALPEEWARKEKLGFPVPLADWLRKPEHYEAAREILFSDEAKLFFHLEDLETLLREHMEGKDHSRKIWMIWMFLLWYRIYFVDCEPPAGCGDASAVEEARRARNERMESGQ